MTATAEVRSDRSGAVYVFELPVRLAHWAIVLAVVVLSLTGAWIGRGRLPETALGDPGMMTVRAIHLLAGWALLAAILLRVGWFFLGNRHASIREWVPTSRARLRELVTVLRFYASLRRPYPGGDGHNPLAGLAYVAAFGALLFMVSSGAALRPVPATWFDALLAAPVAWLDLATLRLLHRLVMYGIFAFLVLHVGLVAILDAETRGRVASAIVSGWRPARGPEGGA